MFDKFWMWSGWVMLKYIFIPILTIILIMQIYYMNINSNYSEDLYLSIKNFVNNINFNIKIEKSEKIKNIQ